MTTAFYSTENFRSSNPFILVDVYPSLVIATGESSAAATAAKLEEVLKAVRDVDVRKKWAATKPGIEALPAKPFQFALYLAFLTQSAKTSAPVEEAVNSISWAHQLAVIEDPADHPLVRQILVGAKQILAHKTTKKEPITPEILHRMFAKSVTPAAELPVIRTMMICLLGYAGFFPFQ